VEQIIKRAIAKSDADYTEIRIEQEARSQVHFRKDKLENIEGSSEQGGIVRVLKDGGWGIAAFNDISNLDGKVEEARARFGEWCKKLKIGWFSFTCCEDSTIMFTEMLNDHFFAWK